MAPGHTGPLGIRSQLAQDFGRRGEVRDFGVGQAKLAGGRHPYGPVRDPAGVASLVLARLKLVREIERE